MRRMLYVLGGQCVGTQKDAALYFLSKTEAACPSVYITSFLDMMHIVRVNTESWNLAA